MRKSIRHLRATTEEWITHNIIIPDGEIAIERDPCGIDRIKIGNGVDYYSDLPYLDGISVRYEDFEGTLLLENARRYRLGCAKLITIDTPIIFPDDFTCEISFSSGEVATEFATNSHLRLSGDDVMGEIFIPAPNMHYTLFIWYDDELHGVVRGIPNA